MRWQSGLSSGQSNPDNRTASTTPVIQGGTTIVQIGLSQGAWACSSDVEEGDLVEITSSGTVGKSNPSAGSGRAIIGFVNAKSSLTACTVQYTGEITLLSPLVPGSQYYAVDGGLVSQTGTFSGVSQPVGVAKTETVLVINITRPILL